MSKSFGYIIFQWISYFIRKLNHLMQLRRDGPMFFFLIIIFFLIILFYQHHYTTNRISGTVQFISPKATNQKFKILQNKYSSEWFEKHCFQIDKSVKIALENLPRYLKRARLSTIAICQEFAEKFDALFRLDEIYGSLKLSPIYLKKVNQWLHNDEILLEQIKKQRIVKIYNRHTHEEMLYNYMRSRRPQTKNEQSAET